MIEFIKKLFIRKTSCEGVAIYRDLKAVTSIETTNHRCKGQIEKGLDFERMALLRSAH